MSDYVERTWYIPVTLHRTVMVPYTSEAETWQEARDEAADLPELYEWFSDADDVDGWWDVEDADAFDSTYEQSWATREHVGRCLMAALGVPVPSDDREASNG